MGFGVIIIGDEILRGRRRDKHLERAIAILGARGLELDWAHYAGDDRARLAELFGRTLATPDIVFSFGGIGCTPDDHTRQAVAAAAGEELSVHPDARREIEARFGAETTPQRLAMGEFPRSARIIPNPYNRIPGFAVARHHFLPGFPQMAWPMMEWALDTWYPELHHRANTAQRSVTVYGAYESKLIDLMQAIERDFEGVKVFSLPSFGAEGVRPHIELGARGDPGQVGEAMKSMVEELDRRGLEWVERE